MKPTVAALNQAFPREKIVAFGLNSDDRQNVFAYSSGNLPVARVPQPLTRRQVSRFPFALRRFRYPRAGEPGLFETCPGA